MNELFSYQRLYGWFDGYSMNEWFEVVQNMDFNN